MAVDKDCGPRASMILDEAERISLNQGFRRLNIDDLARTLRISKKTIYDFFPSKEELFFAALNRRASRLVQQLKVIVASQDSAGDKLYAASQLIARDISDLDVSLMRDLEELFPDFYIVSQEYFRKLSRYISAILVGGGAQRGVPRRPQPGAGDPALPEHRGLRRRPGIPGAQPPQHGEGL